MNTTYRTPDGLYEVESSGLTEGERRKQGRLSLLRERRAVFVRRGQRALLARLLEAGTATADDVAAVVELPDDVDGRCLGAVPGALARLGVVRILDYRRSHRPTRHASVQAVWELVDRNAALRWLASNPDMPDPTYSESDGRQLELGFLNTETPTVAAAGASF